MKRNSICFIGCGNMAQAIISKMASTDWDPNNIHVIDPNDDKLERVKKEFGINVHREPGAWIAQIDAVLLAVKPQDLLTALNSIKQWLYQSLVISIAAGVKVSDLAKIIGHNQIVRVMPNTPVKIGLGVCGIYETEEAKPDHEFTIKVFAPSGDIIWCDKEEMIDAVTAVSGSGPAYVFRFIEALQQAALRYGFNEPQARRMAIATVLGASTLAKESFEPIEQLRQNVTSKGGTTYEALKVMEEKGFMPMMQEAMDACKNRAGELAENFSKSIENK